MIKSIVMRALDKLAARYDYDVTYARALYLASPTGFRTFMAVGKMSRHREVVPIAASFAAKLVGTLVEDCGPCTQLVVDMAREIGMADAQIEAVLTSDVRTMSPDTALGFRFATAIARRLPDEDDARVAVRAQWGEKAVVDLTFALQGSRMFPMVKAGLGFAHECRRVRVGAHAVDVVRRIA